MRVKSNLTHQEKIDQSSSHLLKIIPKINRFAQQAAIQERESIQAKPCSHFRVKYWNKTLNLTFRTTSGKSWNTLHTDCQTSDDSNELQSSTDQEQYQ